MFHIIHAPKRLYKMIKEEFGFNAIYKKTQTLGDILQKKGRTIEKQHQKKTVYSIPCQQCPKKYVGQTTATIKKRCSEHRNWCQKKHKKKIFKLQRRKLELLFIIMKRDTLLILRIRKLKLLQKKSIPVGKG